MNSRKTRENAGITLIALIITIIILVILAAVSINAVYNMGIVGHAINGAQEYASQAKAENQMMADTTSKIDDAVAKVKEIQGDEIKQNDANGESDKKKTITVHLSNRDEQCTLSSPTDAQITHEELSVYNTSPYGFNVSSTSDGNSDVFVWKEEREEG